MEKPKKSNELAAADNDTAESPGAVFTMFTTMEDLIDKLKLLDYEKEFLRELKLKPLNKHYFAIPTNTGEQFFMFVSLAAWLIRKSKKPFEIPLESDDPNATISGILDHVRRLGFPIDFPPNRLKQGNGEQAILILDKLADQALKVNHFVWEKPIILEERNEIEEENNDVDELDLEQVEEEMAAQYGSDEDDYDQNFLDYKPKNNTVSSQIRAHIMQSDTNAEDWKMEVERVIPHLKLAAKADEKNWRSRLDLLRQYNNSVTKVMYTTQSLLEAVETEVGKSMERVDTREKYLNRQLEPLLNQHCKLQEQLKQIQEKYQTASVGIQARNQKLNELNEEIQLVKQELDERSSHMTDGTPLVNLKKVLGRLRNELTAMDVRIGVINHVFLQSRLKHSTALQHQLIASSSNI